MGYLLPSAMGSLSEVRDVCIASLQEKFVTHLIIEYGNYNNIL